jgi:hypothetical protein
MKVMGFLKILPGMLPMYGHSSIENIATLIFKLGSLSRYETLFEILHVAATLYDPTVFRLSMFHL